MTQPQVFIPSRGRWEGARKLTEAWHQEGFGVNWVVEPSEWLDYDYEAEGDKVHELPLSDMGIGYSRNHCLNIASACGYEAIILADDDIKPAAKGGHMEALIDIAEHPKVLGVTAKYSYHDLCLGPDFKYLDGPILLPSGTFRLVGLNVANVMSIGNYDASLQGLEDNDLFLRGLKAGFPWLVHASTWSTSIGTRLQPGGLSDFMKSNGIPKDEPWPWLFEMEDRYPGIASGAHANRIRFAWKKAYDAYLPDWRKWSELHGGSLDVYLNG